MKIFFFLLVNMNKLHDSIIVPALSINRAEIYNLISNRMNSEHS
jgi:hypothetical protein